MMATVTVPAAGLFVAACRREAALFAVKAWHYSRTLPAGRMFSVGAWEDGEFIGAVVFSRGATGNIGSPFGLRQDQICELARVALRPHACHTSQVVAQALRRLRAHNPGLRLLVSYADPEHGHVGVLYQAMGWLFAGPTAAESMVRLHGRVRHGRSVVSLYGTRSIAALRATVDAAAEAVTTLPKYRYLCPLDEAMRRQLAPRVLPYPKRSGGRSIGSDALHRRGSSSPVPVQRGRRTSDPAAPSCEAKR
jgi:hypothetical protein